MPQTWTILLQWFQWGIGNHDTYLGENQVAYAENVHLRDPEFIKLEQKAENYALTDNDLVLSKLELEYDGHAYLWTQGGKMYDKGSNIVLCTTAYAQAISSLFVRGNTYLYFCMWTTRVGRIETDYLVDWSSWVAWDLEAQSTYNESYKTSTSDFPVKSREVDGSEVMCLVNGNMKSGDNTLTYVTLTAIAWTPIWLWTTLNYWKAFNHRGYLTFADGTSTQVIAGKDYDSFYIEWFQSNDQEFLVSGINQENSNIFAPSGEAKVLIAQSRTSWPDARELHYYGRKTNPFSDFRNRQRGNDTVWAYNDVCYMINKKGVMSYGSTVPWLSKARSLITRNYNGDLIDEVGMVKVETESATGDNWLYYSWRVGSTCGVDRINLDKIGNPNLFQDSGYVYTQKYNFWHAKASINKIKIRATTTAGQTIKVYSSVDGGAWTLKQTLNDSTASKFFVLDGHEQAYTIQWKLELETNDEDETPVLYAMSFNYTIWDNE